MSEVSRREAAYLELNYNSAVRERDHYKKGLQQAKSVLSPLSTIMTGDFNKRAAEKAYQIIAKALKGDVDG